MMEDWKMSNSAQTSASSRIAALLDENSFVEVGAYIAARNTDFNMTEQETPADGVVTGYGTIGGCLVYVYSQDAAVLGGSMGEMHAKKICNIYSMAMKMGAPVIGLVDCAGLRLQEATDALDGFGKLYLSQTMASGVMATMPAVMATSMLYRAAMCCAICGGATALSHVNDAGFWLVGTFLEIDEKTTLKSWTIMETLIGITSLIIALIVSIFA